VVDTIVLWLPAAVFLGLEGRWGEVLGVAALGSVLVRAIENFLYPILVKDRLRLHPVSIFVSLLGGLLLFGWSGLVLGPVALTITAVLLEDCASRIVEPKAAPETRSAQGSSDPTPAAAEQTWVSGVAAMPLNPGNLLKPPVPQVPQE
jgi:predicted PurR-regulated permease PerM